MYFSDVDDEKEVDDPYFEITVRSYEEPEVPGKTVIWGIPATKEKVASRVLVGQIDSLEICLLIIVLDI